MSRRTRRFRECFDRLPPDIRSQAKRAYELFRDDPRHSRSPFQKGPPDRARLIRSGQPRLPRCRRPPRGRDHLVLNRLPCRLRPSPVTALNGELAASDHVADPALPHQAGRVRLPGHLPSTTSSTSRRSSGRWPSRRSTGFRLGPLYTPQTLGGTIMRPTRGGRRELVGRGRRSRDRLSLRAVDQRPLDPSAHRAGAARAVDAAVHPAFGFGRPPWCRARRRCGSRPTTS